MHLILSTPVETIKNTRMQVITVGAMYSYLQSYMLQLYSIKVANTVINND